MEKLRGEITGFLRILMINREREISSASLALSLSSIFWAGVVVREILHIEIILEDDSIRGASATALKLIEI